MRIEPTLRPELTSVVASVALPELSRPPGARSGKTCAAARSRWCWAAPSTFTATASRELQSAQVDGQSLEPAGATITSPPAKVEGSRKMEFRWQDRFGLAGKEPFVLAITGREDEAPSLACEDLPRQKVVLDTELLSFKIRAQDDFGIKQIGIDWQGVDNPIVSTPAKGERILSAGGHDKESLEISGTFSAKSLGIEPQPVQVRLFAEDYLPGRERVYSPTYTFYVLNAEQHAIWVTEQLSKWHRQSLEVRDKEMQLYETNKQLRALAAEELDRPETRRKIENQAAAERTNGRRLIGLTVNRRRPDQAGDAQPGIQHRQPGKMGRDAPDLEGHRRQPHAVGRRPVEGSGPGPERGHGTRRTTRRGWPAKIAPADRPRRRSPPTKRRSRRRAFRDRRPGIVAAAARRQGRPGRRPRASSKTPGSRCP